METQDLLSSPSSPKTPLIGRRIGGMIEPAEMQRAIGSAGRQSGNLNRLRPFAFSGRLQEPKPCKTPRLIFPKKPSA